MRQEVWEGRAGLWGHIACFVGIQRAEGAIVDFSVLARSSGFGMENGWDVHVDKPLETMADVLGRDDRLA